jgi:hypothetical protein
MAKIFNNTDKKRFNIEKNLTLNGWEKTINYDDTRIGHITDTVGAGIAMAKMGTSIPTPFARIQLFDTAFGQVNNLGHDSDSVYGKLVSECLDFLEFIFNYGTDITIKKWSVREQIENLKKSTPKHQNLGKCLEKFALDLNVKDIYLFYYNGVLIGGSSPYTLVYTSPNWQRNKTITNARGLNGNLLFDDYASTTVDPWPLHKRHKDFREFLTKYIIAFRNVPGFSETQFYKYIYKNQEEEIDLEMREVYRANTEAEAYNPTKFREEYDILKMGADVDVKGVGGAYTLYIGCKKVFDPPKIVSEDYKIQATCERFRSHYTGGETPLVLNDYGITSAIYVGGLPWSADTVLTRNPYQSLDERILPGGGHVLYPYLTDADFLEDKLLRMSYPINQQAFRTFVGATQYLLPLKPAFFDYFNVEDINHQKNLTLNIQEVGNDVEVTLTIPVKCQTQPYIELKKTYKGNEDIVRVPPTPGFSMAIFPSYKLVNTQVPNNYSVLLHDSSDHGSLGTTFYALKDTAIEEVEVSERVERTARVSTYVGIDRAFDFVTIKWEGIAAMLIPNFKVVTPNSVTKGLAVGIDFGTTNSYVCLSYNGGADPMTLEISRDDIQVLTLNEVNLSKGNYGLDYQDSFRGMIAFNQAIDREFAPLLLGKQSDVQFPYRTVTCESNRFAGKTKPMLFGHIDLGFNFMKEIIDLTDVQYNTNIKWDIENNADGAKVNLTDCENRVKAFCLQVAWMVKNKIMLGQTPASRFTAYLTFPYTMGRSLKTDIENFWTEAFEKTMGEGNVEIKRSTESIAPYFFMIGNGAKFSKNALNVDIGGGTTDMLFADIEKKRFWYNSSLFAGNDIWGDGKQLVSHSRLDNGFVKYFESLLDSGEINTSNERKEAYKKYKKLVSSSADLMSYIFRYNDEFNFISYIRKSKDKLMPILYTHLGAVVYHIAQVLKAKEMTVPSTITFSGMGAQYIHFISTQDSDITELIKSLLAEFMGYGFEDDEDKMPRDFKVSFQKSPKEVTAQGAMLEDNPALDDIKSYSQKELYVYGITDAPKHILYKEANDYKPQAQEMFEQFIKDFLLNRDIAHYLNKQFEVRFSEEFVKTLREHAEMGFDLMAKSKRGDEDIEETLFFWPLKNGLYEASKL